MSAWTKAWLAWVAATGISFTVIEVRALKQPGASLSEHLRTGFGFDNLGPAPRFRRGLFYAVWGWFGLHILSETSGCLPNALADVVSGDAIRDALCDS